MEATVVETRNIIARIVAPIESFSQRPALRKRRKKLFYKPARSVRVCVVCNVFWVVLDRPLRSGSRLTLKNCQRSKICCSLPHPTMSSNSMKYGVLS